MSLYGYFSTLLNSDEHSKAKAKQLNVFYSSLLKNIKSTAITPWENFLKCLSPNYFVKAPSIDTACTPKCFSQYSPDFLNFNPILCFQRHFFWGGWVGGWGKSSLPTSKNRYSEFFNVKKTNQFEFLQFFQSLLWFEQKGLVTTDLFYWCLYKQKMYFLKYILIS